MSIACCPHNTCYCMYRVRGVCKSLEEININGDRAAATFPLNRLPFHLSNHQRTLRPPANTANTVGGTTTQIRCRDALRTLSHLARSSSSPATISCRLQVVSEYNWDISQSTDHDLHGGTSSLGDGRPCCESSTDAIEFEDAAFCGRTRQASG